MSWNLNSLAKDNFHRVSLIDAHNSLYNYDLLSLCETSLNDSVIYCLVSKCFQWSQISYQILEIYMQKS